MSLNLVCFAFFYSKYVCSMISTCIFSWFSAIKAVDSIVHEHLLWRMLTCLKSAVERSYAVENAGSLHWMFTIVFATLQVD